MAGFRRAALYMRLYRGQIFVVKCGGEALARQEDAIHLLEQIAVLHQLGIGVVLVHGGGVQATGLAERLGATSTFIKGRRVTDAGMLEAVTLALNGQIKTQLLAAGKALGLPTVGLSGIDAGIADAVKRPASKESDFGFVGDITAVDPGPLDLLLEGGYVPVVSPLCADEHGQVLNVNADTFASAIAVALGAAKLILVTGVRGILRELSDTNSLISHLTLAELESLETQGVLAGGMLPKAESIGKALQGGVPRVHVIGFDFADSLLTEVFTNEGCGTLIVPEETELTAEEAEC